MTSVGVGVFRGVVAMVISGLSRVSPVPAYKHATNKNVNIIITSMCVPKTTIIIHVAGKFSSVQIFVCSNYMYVIKYFNR